MSGRVTQVFARVGRPGQLCPVRRPHHGTDGHVCRAGGRSRRKSRTHQRLVHLRQDSMTASSAE
jgi:hypothetical protein